MGKRREYGPLLGAHRGSSWLASSGTATCLGVICGIALGGLVTLSLFAWVPRHQASATSQGGDDDYQYQTLHDALPDVKKHSMPSTDDQFYANHRHASYPQFKSVDGVNTSNEGTRKLSESERFGGWRLLPEVLEVAKRHPKAKVVSEVEPTVLLFEQFISPEEVEHIVKIASTHMARSKVVSDKQVYQELCTESPRGLLQNSIFRVNNGTKGLSQTRTSYGAWLSRKWRDNVIASIEERIHDTVGVPKDFGEGIYVLRYQQDQKYDPHTDSCARKGEKPRDACINFLKRAKGPACGEGFGGASCGDRIATFILYLRTPKKGGATVFPVSRNTKEGLKKIHRDGEKWNRGPRGWYCNDPAVFKIAPNPGDAVLFWDYIPRSDVADHKNYTRSGSHQDENFDTEAVNDPSALHGGCPVVEGEKWIATRWIRSTKFH